MNTKMLTINVVHDNKNKIKKIESVSLSDFKREAGVWFLLGKSNSEDNGLICLQVAQADDISKEIKRNCRYLLGEKTYLVDEKYKTEPIEKNYISQFGEELFKYEEHLDERCKSLYKDIGEKYKELQFVCIIGNKLKERDYRRKLEKHIAVKTQSKYWVNGRPFKIKEKKEKKEI